jgi:serine/threonine protein kinase
MAVVTTVDDFLDVVRKSKVLDEEKVTAFLERLSRDQKTFEKPEQIATKLYQEGLLSTFQARQLLQGRWRRFSIGGKYRLLEMIGQGGMGAVYLCEHVSLRRLVALKVMPEDKIKAPGALERFQREARAIAQLDHPNVVRAFDMGQDAGVHFMVMEYIDGVNLERLITKYHKNKGLPLTRACQYVADTACALQHAHEIGWVHRDIKPANVLVDRYGNVKLLDLGLTRLFEGDQENLTQRFDEGNVLGTADYIAPEQALNVSAADIRADIYGLGCTFYFLLAGRPPFATGTVAQKLVWHQTKNPEPIRSLRPDLPEEVGDIITKMIAKKPEDRYSIPQEIVEALHPWLAEPVPPPTSEEVPMLCPLVRQLLPTAAKQNTGRIRRAPTQSMSGPITVPEVLPETPVTRAEAETLKDETRSKSPTHKTLKPKVPVQTGLSREQKRIIIIAALVGLLTVVATVFVMLLLLRG